MLHKIQVDEVFLPVEYVQCCEKRLWCIWGVRSTTIGRLRPVIYVLCVWAKKRCSNASKTLHVNISNTDIIMF